MSSGWTHTHTDNLDRKPDGKIDAIVVKFDQEDAGKEQRERYKHYSEKSYD